MSEKFPRITEVVRQAPVETETGVDSLSIASFLDEKYPGKYRDVKLDELPESVMKEAVTETNKSRIRGALAPSILMKYPNGEAFSSPEVQKFFELLDGLVDSSYEVSAIINQGNLRTSELGEDEKLKLNHVSKLMAELIDLIGCDTEAALNIKVLFVESMLQGFDIHKYRNHRLQGSGERSDSAYLHAESAIVEQLQYYLDVWMRGAVDVEVALQRAVKGTQFVKSVDAATPEEDVSKGVDFWLKMDWDELNRQGKIPFSILNNDVDKLVLGGKMAVQVKSQLDRNNDHFDTHQSLSSASVRRENNDSNVPYIKYCRSEKTGTPGYYQVTVDVETRPGAYLKKELFYGNKRITVSQLDFSRAISEIGRGGDLDKIPEMIFNKHTVLRKQYEARK